MTLSLLFLLLVTLSLPSILCSAVSHMDMVRAYAVLVAEVRRRRRRRRRQQGQESGGKRGAVVMP